MQGAGLENLDLLLNLLQRALTELQQFRATLVRRKRLLERELAGFHRGNDIFKLGERRLEILRLL